MRIALVKQRYSLRHGGSERYCVTLARRLQAAGHDVTVIGEKIDADEIVRLAEQSYAASPSSATHAALLSTLMFRAVQTLQAGEPPFARFVSGARRAVDSTELIAAAASQNEPLRAVVLANPDVTRAVALMVEDRVRFPVSGSIVEWALLRWADPDEAAKIAEAVKKSTLPLLTARLSRQLSPVSGSAAYRAAWALEISGDSQAADQVLRDAVERGVPLPKK